MTDTPRPLHVLKYDVDQDVVETLRQALRDAERGEIRAVAFACVRQGQETSSTLVAGHGDNTVRLIGVTAHLQHRLHQQLDVGYRE